MTDTVQPTLPIFSLAGDVALITGGGSGIGLAIAHCMVQAGATVIITGRREQPLQEAVAEIGGNAHYVVNDAGLGSVPHVHKFEPDTGHRRLDDVSEKGVQRGVAKLQCHEAIVT